tara:strand:- start:278 stop:394 length:117 start_codon:yes stop_codon:yes gene_type:complete
LGPYKKLKRGVNKGYDGERVEFSGVRKRLRGMDFRLSL